MIYVPSLKRIEWYITNVLDQGEFTNNILLFKFDLVFAIMNKRWHVYYIDLIGTTGKVN